MFLSVFSQKCNCSKNILYRRQLLICVMMGSLFGRDITITCDLSHGILHVVIVVVDADILGTMVPPLARRLCWHSHRGRKKQEQVAEGLAYPAKSKPRNRVPPFSTGECTDLGNSNRHDLPYRATRNFRALCLDVAIGTAR